jgi:hypothetical protein
MTKALVEDCLVLSISELFRNSSVVEGEFLAGTLEWYAGDQSVAKMNYEADLCLVDNANLRLRYIRDGQGHDYQISLSTTSLHFGGHRWWMHCPASDRRVAKLYLPDGRERFASRQECDLTYKSCRESRRRDALFRRIAKWKD